MSRAAGEAIAAPVAVSGLDRAKARRLPLALWFCAIVLLTGVFGRIMVTPRGRYLLRVIARCFDAYADHPRIRYSRAM